MSWLGGGSTFQNIDILAAGELDLASTDEIQWSSTTDPNGTPDINIKRDAASVMEVGDGSTGFGKIQLGDLALKAAGVLNWSSTSDPAGSADTGVKRDAAGVLEITNGSTGFGSLQASGASVIAAGTINWSSTTDPGGAADVGFKRDAAYTVEVTDGSTGYGYVQAQDYSMPSAGYIQWKASSDPGGTKNRAFGIDSTSGAIKALSWSKGAYIQGGLQAAEFHSGYGVQSYLLSYAPVEAASTQAGVAVNITASNATAGSTNAGAEAGGNVVITAGNAAQKTSGNANGGDIRFSPGAGIGTGVIGRVQIASDTAQLTLGASSDAGIIRYGAASLKITNASTGIGSLGVNNIGLIYTGQINWANHATDPFNGPDVGISRITGNTLLVGNGAGASGGYLTAGGYQAGSGGYYKFSSDASSYGTPDVGLARYSAGVLKVTDGSTGTGALLVDGAIAAPTIKTSAGAGLYSHATGYLGYAVAGLHLNAFVAGSAWFPSDGVITWSLDGYSGTLGCDADKDIGLARSSAGVLKVTGGGSNLGSLNASNLTLTSLGTPATPVITNAGATGATTYSYKIVAKLNDGTTTSVGSAGSTATGNATLDADNYNIITWSSTTGAVSYDVYRSAGGATQGKILTGVTSPQHDHGEVASGSEPTYDGTGYISLGSTDLFLRRTSASVLWLTTTATGTVAAAIGLVRCVDIYKTDGTPIISLAGNYATPSYNAIALASSVPITWAATDTFAGTPDIGLARYSAGVLYVTDGSGTNDNGSIYATTFAFKALAGTGATLQTSDATAGNDAIAGAGLSILADNAVAGTLNAGAAAGGDVGITAGNAARKDSGNANGGNIVLTPGTGIGTGVVGAVQILSDTGQLKFGASSDVGLVRAATGTMKVTDGSTGYGYVDFGAQLYKVGTNIAGFSALGSTTNQLYIRCDGGVGIENGLGSDRTFYLGGAIGSGYGSTNAGLKLAATTALEWGNTALNVESTADIGLARSAAGVLKVTDGSTGDGNIVASSAITAVAGGGTVPYNGVIRTGVYKRVWTAAEVTAFGAASTGDLKVATLPAKTVVRNAYLVTTANGGSGLTALTVSLGRTSANYDDYITDSNLKVDGTLGSELVTNGGFTGDASGWTLGGGGGTPDWFYDTNKVSHASDGAVAALEPSTPLSITAGQQYKLVWTMTHTSGTGVTASVGGTNGTQRASSATFTEYITATTTGNLKFTPTANWVGSLDDISLKAVGNVVYGDASGERGTNLTGYDLPSYTAATDVYLHFDAAAEHLDDSSGCTGIVYLLTETLP